MHMSRWSTASSDNDAKRQSARQGASTCLHDFIMLPSDRQTTGNCSQSDSRTRVARRPATTQPSAQHSTRSCWSHHDRLAGQEKLEEQVWHHVSAYPQPIKHSSC